MKEITKVLLTLIFINFFILGCANIDTNSDVETLTLECAIDVNYINTFPPEYSYSSDFNAPTVILIHGENSSPLSSDIQNLAADFNYDGYNVVIPYMPWSGFQWNGTLCDGISYMNYLVSIEIAHGNPVVLAGHSLGGTSILAYSALGNTLKPDVVTIIAPGYFIQQDSILADANKESVLLAKDMVENNQSDVETIFQTYTNGVSVAITATPSVYLSYHDTEEFPDIKSTTPLVRTPLLWLAGVSDPLTDTAITFGIIDLIPYSENNSYREISGDHFTLLERVSDSFGVWYNNI